MMLTISFMKSFLVLNFLFNLASVINGSFFQTASTLATFDRNIEYGGQTFINSSPVLISSREFQRYSTGRLLNIRGGAAKSSSSKKKASDKSLGPTKKKSSPIKAVKELLVRIKPATRTYLIVCVICTLVHLVGLPAPDLFSLDKNRLWQLWRPFTSVAYLGGPSMSMANSLYFLVNYGQSLETQNGTADHSWFLIVQTTILTLLGLVIGFPFQAQAMIAAAVYVSSHVNPMERIPFQFGFVITAWQLPFCMMLIDVLSQQNAAAAWPHVLGILSGHFFHFFTRIWPELGGSEILKTPELLIKILGGRPKSNVEGLDLSGSKGSTRSKKYASKLGSGKGKKLGTK